MNQLNTYILAKLADMEQERIKNHIEPCGIEMPELQKLIIEDVKIAINELYRKGEITYYKTLNNIAFKLCNPIAQLRK